MDFLGKPVTYWLELQKQAELNRWDEFINNTVELRKKLQITESELEKAKFEIQVMEGAIELIKRDMQVILAKGVLK